MKIKCEHPIFIQNPLAYRLCLQGYNLIRLDGRSASLLPSQCIDAFKTQRIVHPILNIVDHYEHRYDSSFPNYDLRTLIPVEELANYMPIYCYSEEILLEATLVNPSTGEFIPLFQQVKCGRCILCQQSKKYRWSYRCLMESASHKYPPYFVTLTYSPTYYKSYEDFRQEAEFQYNFNYVKSIEVIGKQLSRSSKFVSKSPTLPSDVAISLIQRNLYRSYQVEELQKFIKRLRINLKRAGYTTDFKYFIASEHGSTYGRLHYHALFYGVHEGLNEIVENDEPNSQYNFQYLFQQYVREAWNKGFVEAAPAKDGSGRYAQKYIGKNSEKPVIHLHSQRFGRSVIMDNLESIRENPEEKSFPLNFNGRIVNIPIYNYVSDIAYPSFCRAVPLEFRKLLKRNYMLFTHYNHKYQLGDRGVIKLFKYFFNNYGTHLTLFNICQFSDYRISVGRIRRKEILEEFHLNLLKLDEYDLDIREIEKLVSLHERHVRANRTIDYEIALEVFHARSEINKYYDKETDGQ